MIYHLILLYFIACIYVIEAALPKCENIIRDSDDGKPACWYCDTERLSKECKDLCQSKGCTKDSGGGSKGGSDGGSSATSKPSGSSGGGGSSGSSSGGGSSSNSKCDNLEPCIDIDTANKRFYQCCKDRELSNTCWKYCKYDVKKKTIQDAFLHHECELGESRDFLYCAAEDKDNNYCCKEKKVTEGDREICEPFCNPGSDNWPKKAEAKYLKCLGQFDAILRCHWAARKP